MTTTLIVKLTPDQSELPTGVTGQYTPWSRLKISVDTGH